MRHLVWHEIKKLFKNKINIVLIAILLGYTGYVTWQDYEYDTRSRMGLGYLNEDGLEYVDYFKDENGNIVDGLDYLKYVDSVLHSYRGKADQQLLDKMQKDYDAKTKGKFQLDEQKMETRYGKDYEKLYQQVQKGELTTEDVNSWCNKHPNENLGCGLELNENKEVRMSYIYYKNSGYLRLMNQIYKGTQEVIVEDYGEPSYAMILANKKDYTYMNNPGLWDYELSMSVPGQQGHSLESKNNADYYTYLSNRFEKSDAIFDSTIPNEKMWSSMSNLNFFTMLLIAFILANSFAIEKQYKTDQILVPSATGNLRLTVAKLIAGTLVGMSIVVAQIGLVLLICQICLPVRDFGLFMGSQMYARSNFDGWTYGEVIGVRLGGMILGCLLTTILTMVVSYISKSNFITITIMLLATLVPLFIRPSEIFGNSFGVILEQSIPGAMCEGGFTGIRNGVSPLLNIQGVMVNRIFIVGFVWFVIMVVLLSGMLLHAKKHMVENR